MEEITLIIHGWSDSSDSFAPMKRFLTNNGVGNVNTVYYADYESREDNITFEDVVDGLYDSFKEKGFIDKEGNPLKWINVIVHSTGGLVIRHFIARYYSHRIDRCPIKKIVMLAPANFGSPLAHYGKSLLGIAFKGRRKLGNMFEVGRKLLNGLELASPYQWELSHKDIFTQNPIYTPDRIQTFIFVGARGYEGYIRKLANKKGTDGTVVVAGTNINPVKFSVDFAGEEEKITFIRPNTDTAFCVLKDYDHGTIVEEVKPDENSLIGKLLLEALRVQTREEFKEFKAKLSKITEETYKEEEIYQQFVIRTVDDHRKPVKDYTLEFFVYKYEDRYIKKGEIVKRRMSSKEIKWSEKLHDHITDEFHTNSSDPSLRRFLVGLNKLEKLLEECYRDMGDVILSVRVHIPKVDDGIFYDTKKLKNIFLLRTQGGRIVKSSPSLFYPNTTTLMELKVNRSTKYVTLSTKPRKH